MKIISVTAFHLAPRGRLTVREMEVLRRLARGQSREQMAKEMCMAPRTVKCHVTHICEKLNAAKAIHAVAIGYEIGLLVVGDAG